MRGCFEMAENTPTMSEPNQTVCGFCKEPVSHTIGECPACQSPDDTRKALLATRKALREIYAKLGNPDSVYACGAIMEILNWPKPF